MLAIATVANIPGAGPEPSAGPSWIDVGNFWVQLLGSLTALLAALWAIYTYWQEQRQNRQLREVELRWRKMEAGKRLLDELGNDDAVQSAYSMLDADPKPVQYDPEQPPVKITREVWTKALDPKSDPDDKLGNYVRDAFDNLIYYFTILEHLISSGFVRFDDISYPLSYYVRKMEPDRELFLTYANDNHMDLAPAFLDRFALCKSRKPRGSAA